MARKPILGRNVYLLTIDHLAIERRTSEKGTVESPRIAQSHLGKNIGVE
ncbi:hypothetical protein [Novipirellula herctigrandis]